MKRIARWLADNDFRHAFGIIGGGNVAIWNAIHELGRTRLIPVHHEQAAAMAATYYFRASGRGALCLVTTGAGSANAITGVLASYFDSVPLLVISGNERTRFLEEEERVKGTQGFRVAEVVHPITKAVWTLGARDEPGRILDWMWSEARGGRPGPVWLDIPRDIQ